MTKRDYILSGINAEDGAGNRVRALSPEGRSYFFSRDELLEAACYYYAQAWKAAY